MEASWAEKSSALLLFQFRASSTNTRFKVSGRFSSQTSFRFFLKRLPKEQQRFAVEIRNKKEGLVPKLADCAAGSTPWLLTLD